MRRRTQALLMSLMLVAGLVGGMISGGWPTTPAKAQPAKGAGPEIGRYQISAYGHQGQAGQRHSGAYIIDSVTGDVFHAANGNKPGAGRADPQGQEVIYCFPAWRKLHAGGAISPPPVRGKSQPTGIPKHPRPRPAGCSRSGACTVRRIGQTGTVEGRPMTGAEWLSGDDPAVMLEFIRVKASTRRLRLFAVACCRRVASSVYYAGYLEAVEVAEQHADGLRDDAALRLLTTPSKSRRP